MGFFSELTIGLRAYKKAFKFTNTHQLWGYYIIPAFINLMIVAGIGWGIYHYTADLSHVLSGFLGIDEKEGWFWSIIDYTLLLLLYTVIILFFTKIYKVVMLILLSPVLSILAEKTQIILTGNPTKPFNFSKLLKDILRGISIAIRNLFLEITLMVLLVLLSFIPIFAPVATILLLLVEYYFLGFSMMDYHNEYYDISASESIRMIRKHKGLAVGNGFGLYMIFFLPIVGVMIGPPLAVIAAGLSMHNDTKS